MLFKIPNGISKIKLILLFIILLSIDFTRQQMTYRYEKYIFINQTPQFFRTQLIELQVILLNITLIVFLWIHIKYCTFMKLSKLIIKYHFPFWTVEA